MVPPLHTLTTLIREAGKAAQLESVYACLDAMRVGDLVPDAPSLEVVVQAMVKSCSFVTGGVSMQTLPNAVIPEVAFIGRSNVGKSSLVNMVLGRKAIAYTSKTPGKTQQYNYFVLNQGREQGAFHLVDLPGLGFAKVEAAQRQKWKRFLREYAASRPQLRLLVHLIDGRLGPQDVDLDLMRLIGGVAAGAPVGWQYRIVFTKADKLNGKVDRKVEEATRRAVLETGCLLDSAPVKTSAKSKLGRHDMWRMLRPVMLPE